MSHVLCGVSRDQHQRRRRFTDIEASFGDRRSVYLSEVHGLSHVLSCGGFYRRNCYRQVSGSTSSRGVDGKSTMAAASLKVSLTRSYVQPRRISIAGLDSLGAEPL